MSSSFLKAGENLHYNDNNQYWTRKRSEFFMDTLKAESSPSPSPKNNVRHMSSIESFDADEVYCKTHEVSFDCGQLSIFCGNLKSHLIHSELLYYRRLRNFDKKFPVGKILDFWVYTQNQTTCKIFVLLFCFCWCIVCTLIANTWLLRFGINYRPDDGKPFWNHPNAFQLGRYGPHR